jgi:alkylation response protein AidB-like acyl-CoA dehydrogenase
MPSVLTEEHLQLRRDVRAFLAAERRDGSLADPPPGRFHPEFSRRLAARGWVGMALPRRYGGGERSAVDRFVVLEELLAAGAPLAAHFVAERQTAPSLLAYGTEEQRERFLPAIARAECWFAIGMSEPDAGSDLASVRTRATRASGGWQVSGTKLWTSNAQHLHYFVVLCRTGEAADRHEGLSQLIVDLHSPGVSIRPITMLNGATEFNEVVLDAVFVPDDLVLGEIGNGWRQVTSELAFERSGPDRYMSSVGLLRHFVRHRKRADSGLTPEQRREVARLWARLWAIRSMSLEIAAALDAGAAPAFEAALVKDLGTVYEQDVVATIERLVNEELDVRSDDAFERELANAVLIAPAYTIRGGATDVLRTIVSRRLR